jgi:hypothetical protein
MALIGTRTRFLVIAACASVLIVLLSSVPASAHSHSDLESNGPCQIWGEHSHTSTVIDADTLEWPSYVSCTGVEVIARWKTDTTTYVDVSTDTTCCIYAASAGTTSGWDIFYSSDHKGKSSGSSWFTTRLWH